MLLEVGGCQRDAVLLEVGRRPAGHAAHGSDLDGGEARIRQVADADRDVDAFLDDVHRPVDEEGASRHERITAGMDVSMPGAVVSVMDKRPVWQRVGDLDERSDPNTVFQASMRPSLVDNADWTSIGCATATRMRRLRTDREAKGAEASALVRSDEPAAGTEQLKKGT